jgi:microcystin degradation protein MlrC
MPMSKANPKIAILGFSLETNGFSPPSTRADFEQSYLMRGAELEADIRSEHPRANGTLPGFVREMNATGDWTMAPLTVAATSPGGPAEQSFFDAFLADVDTGLRAALPVDGVYISEHGAASSTGDFDPDGTLFERVRSIVGPDVPVVATLDLHANVSQRMVDTTDVLISYLTNPHVDQVARGTEAARAMRELLGGVRTAKALVRIPLMPPSVTLLTGVGESDDDIRSGKLQRPYGELIRAGQRLLGPAEAGAASVLNVSISAGFFLTDSPKAGMTVLVTTRGDQAAANALARDLARQAWSMRDRFAPKLVPMEEAVGRVLRACNDPQAAPVCLADVADNPGGGGRGNTTELLRALLEAGAREVALAAFNDAALAAEAHRLGVGTRFTARFNRAESHPMSAPLAASAQVMGLSDGQLVGRRGSAQGRKIVLGPTARLRLFGLEGGEARASIDVVVISIRQQCTDPAIPEHLGIDLAKLRGFVVKSRGHFRAGFSEFYDDARILDVDAPGLSTPVLARLPYRHLPRPIFPIDPQTHWQAAAD